MMGRVLLPLLEQPRGQWPHVSITYLGKPGNYGLSGKRWRYIEYDNGDKELYDIQSDRYEWVNLAEQSEHAQRIAKIRVHAPTTFAEFVPASDESLPKLKWHAAGDSATPASNPDGNQFDLIFTNNREDPVNVYWMDRQGNRKAYGTLAGGVAQALQDASRSRVADHGCRRESARALCGRRPNGPRDRSRQVIVL